MYRKYVGVELHLCHSVIVRKSSDGEVLLKVRIDMTPCPGCGGAGRRPNLKSLLQATFAWTGPPTSSPSLEPPCILALGKILETATAAVRSQLLLQRTPLL